MVDDLCPRVATARVLRAVQVDLDSGKSCSKIAWIAGIASENIPREALSGVSASKPGGPTTTNTKYPRNVVPIVTGNSGPEYARGAPFFLIAVLANGLEELWRIPTRRLGLRSFFRSVME